MNKLIPILCTAIAMLVSTPVLSQVSNDNEDEVNKMDERQMRAFVPGQAIVKFKDESGIQVRRNTQGKFRAASVNSVDEILRDFAVEDMEKLFPAATPKSQNQLRRKAAPNGAIVQESNLDKVFWIKTGGMSSDSTLQLVKRLQDLPDVEYAEPNYYVYITADMPTDMPVVNTPTDQKIRKASVSVETTAEKICPNPSSNPLYFRQYGITQQNIHQLWNQDIINKKRPVIAILDTGVDINHPDLMDNIWTNPKEADGETAYDDDGNGFVDDVHGWNFVEDYYESTDRNGHGTHCAGIAAAADNAIGIVGANPLALIMPVKVMSDRGLGDVATIVRGIVYAVDNGADVLSMSFGGETLPQAEKDALDYAYQTAILVASAGNNGKNIYEGGPSPGTMYPAAYYLVLGVEASASNLQRASFSNYDPDGPIYSEDGINGRNYEVMVPGDNIYSTLPNGKYDKLSGTSMSAPLFAGAVSALLMVKEYPSKEVLYGDLIHLNADFAQIYSDETPRIPKLDLVAMNVDDHVEGNSNIDGQVDVGETIHFSPVLRNTWADVTDIQLHLKVDPAYSGFVNIENPDVAFGYPLSAYGQAPAATPIEVTFANNIGDNTRIKFVLEVSCHESTESLTQDIYVTVNNMVKIYGIISEDKTLTNNHVYYVSDNLAILEGSTLTIEPGTRLEFAEGVGLSSFGKLVANGTPEKPIIFTGHNGALWSGIKSHFSDGLHMHEEVLYTNETQTLFTLLRTEATPYELFRKEKIVYCNLDNEEDPGKTFYLKDYIDYMKDIPEDWDMTGREALMTDPNCLTSAVLQMLSDWEKYWSQYPIHYSTDKPHSTTIRARFSQWKTYDNPRDTISYCKIDADSQGDAPPPYMKDCQVNLCSSRGGVIEGERINLSDVYSNEYSTTPDIRIKTSNIVNNYWGTNYAMGRLNSNNYFNNYFMCMIPGKYYGKMYSLGTATDYPYIEKAKNPSYLGTSLENIIRPWVYELGNAPNTFSQTDLSNMRTTPVPEAHGIIWKVVVNGKDAQDEYDDLAPLGVGKHKFEVYFNRPMNKAVAPNISFGVREPWTQNVVNEEGSWNDEGTIYTAYKTITGKTKSDGVNRIYVYGAEDNEHFEIPYEKTRFNVMINAAGSMATGFVANAGMGRVNLTWNNEENNFEDAMGFNVYRYSEPYEKTFPAGWYDGNWYDERSVMVADTVCLNSEILDIETTAFTDYDVTPGETYYYYYRVLSTDLQEYDASNVVAATPLTSKMGDANGSGDVDVADVITTVNYAAGMEPKPFIFEAADMNVDKNIDILDVVGIIQKILNTGAGAKMRVEAVATYTVEDGIVYVETPVELAGVQLQLNIPEQTTPAALDALNGFEQASAWLTDEDYIFLSYNMNGKTIPAGKHALLKIGDAHLRSLRLSDTMGSNVMAEAGNATAIEMLTTKALINTHGIYNLQGLKVAGSASDLEKLPNGIYVVDGKKVVK